MTMLDKIGEALGMAAAMAWQTGWSLVLGFLISALLQVCVSRARIGRLLGRDGIRETALAVGFGAASSSCSYAAASVTRTLLAKGAALIPALAFLCSATNLVVELGLILVLLLGWPFAAGEWLGGLAMVAILGGLVRLAPPRRLLEEARERARGGMGGQDHGGDAEGWRALRRREGWAEVAGHFRMDWRMLWKDLLIGFLLAGAVSAFAPPTWWGSLLGGGLLPGVLIAPLLAVVTFVCSVGNVPLAAVLWSGGAGFGAVLAFLYADLIALPLLDVYRRYFGAGMAAYMAGALYAAMVLAGVAVDLLFRAMGVAPHARPDMHREMHRFAFDHTVWLNLGFGLAAAGVLWAGRGGKAKGGCCGHRRG